jgi:hypothetical protein
VCAHVEYLISEEKSVGITPRLNMKGPLFNILLLGDYAQSTSKSSNFENYHTVPARKLKKNDLTLAQSNDRAVA